MLDKILVNALAPAKQMDEGLRVYSVQTSPSKRYEAYERIWYDI